MNANDRLDEGLIDRLVDGELSDVDSRRLLAELEESSGGWRRCALAFVEAQTWRREVRGLRHDMLVRRAVATGKPVGRGVSRWNLVWAVAATFLIAFGIGNRLPLGDSNPRVTPREVVDGQSSVPPAGSSDSLPLGNVVLEIGDGPGMRRVEVPVYPIGQTQTMGDLFATTAIPPRVVRALENMGHEVRRQQRLVPGRLEDGRRVVIPVEEFQIVPVGRKSYQ